MVSGGIYWKSGKLQPGHVNRAAVGQGRRTKKGSGTDQRQGAHRCERGAEEARKEARPALPPRLADLTRCPKSAVPETRKRRLQATKLAECE